MLLTLAVIDTNIEQNRIIELFIKNNITFNFEFSRFDAEDCFNNEIDILLVENHTFHNCELFDLHERNFIIKSNFIVYKFDNGEVQFCNICKNADLFQPCTKSEIIPKINELAVNILSQKLAAHKNDKATVLALKYAKEVHYVKISDIKFLKADGNYTILQLINDKFETTAKTLKSFEFLLNENNFFRPHKSFIVNRDYVEKYIYEGIIVLECGERIPVTRRGRDVMRTFFDIKNEDSKLI